MYPDVGETPTSVVVQEYKLISLLIYYGNMSNSILQHATIKGIILGALLFFTLAIPVIQIFSFTPFLFLAEKIKFFFTSYSDPCMEATLFFSKAIKAVLVAYIVYFTYRRRKRAFTTTAELNVMLGGYVLANAFLAIDVLGAESFCHSTDGQSILVVYNSAPLASTIPVLIGVLFDLVKRDDAK